MCWHAHVGEAVKSVGVKALRGFVIKAIRVGRV